MLDPQRKELGADLAIIIPAYKAEYLEKTLLSLALQTNKHFHVYIGDDCSPENIHAIVTKFRDNLNITYHRFDNNLGRSDLVMQWERCIAMSKDEKWIWLFSDDDIAERDCTSAFFDTLSSTHASSDIYDFNITVIDKDDQIIHELPENEIEQDAMAVALDILNGKRASCMPSNIFNRDTYSRSNGLVNFPFGQSSDWATSIKFSQRSGIRGIQGPRVRWRNSGNNLTSRAYAHPAKKKMIKGFLDFLIWMNTFSINQCDRSTIPIEEIRKASFYNFKQLVYCHYRGVPWSMLMLVARTMREVYEMKLVNSLIVCSAINLRLMYFRVRLFFKF